jgi:hypothetical protein
MVLPEDGADERQKHQSISQTVIWCMKDSALSVGLMKAKFSLSMLVSDKCSIKQQYMYKHLSNRCTMSRIACLFTCLIPVKTLRQNNEVYIMHAVQLVQFCIIKVLLPTDAQENCF